MRQSKTALAAAIFSALACALIIFTHKPSTPSPELIEAVRKSVAIECEDEFGIDASDKNVIKGKIKKNEFLADFLLPHNVDYRTIDIVAKKSKGIYDIRKLNSGKNYTLICDLDSNTAEFFIYELSPIDFIVYDLRDTVSIYRSSRPVTTEQRSAAGVINSSLYQTLIDQNLSPALAMEMADIYAWSIDFYRLQKGDGFKLFYTVKKVDDQEVGVDEIQAAVFNHFGASYYAFDFSQEQQHDYFDENG